MEFHINDRYRDLPDNWPKYHNGEEIKDIKVYNDTQWTVVTNGYCTIRRPLLLAGNYPERGPVFDHSGDAGEEDWKRYSTIIYPEKIHLSFEHNYGIGEGFTAILSSEEARKIGEALIQASEITDIKDGKIQFVSQLVSAPKWIEDIHNRDSRKCK